MATDIDKIVTRAIASGSPIGDLQGDISERFGVAERHARLIARDQVGKLYGQINQARQTALGIDEFEWATVGDERVRDEHEALNGRRFRWDDPPAEGIPGEPIQCRCSAQPVLDNLLDLLDEDDE
jgi:SPP1 gp7 family putative phage head morphogenesis protein